MEHNKDFIQNIIHRMKTVLGVPTDRELAEKFDRSRNAVGVWKSRGTIPIGECIQLAKEEGASLDWLILGRGSRYIGEPAAAASPLHVDVPAYDMTTFISVEDPPATFWHLPRSWMEREGLSPDSTIVVRAAGDAMAPTIQDGQMIVVDRRRRSTDGVYLVSFGGNVRFKRVQNMIDGSTKLSYDNPAYSVDIVPPGQDSKLDIIGYCHAALTLVR